MRERAAELAGGDAGLLQRGGGDQVGDGLGLGEIDTAAEEAALGELAGFGEAGAVCTALANDAFEQHGRAVGGDFDHVFAGVGVRRGEESGDDLVEHQVRVSHGRLRQRGIPDS